MMNTIKDLTPLLVPILVSVLSGLGIWFQEWRQVRSDSFQRKQARDEAEEQITFVEKWLQAEQALSTPEEFEKIKQWARLQLDQAFDKLQQAHEVRAHAQGRPFVQRALLWYRPYGAAGWLAHLFFYSLIALFLLFTFSIIVAPSDSGLTSTSDLIGTIVVLTIVFSIPTVVLQAWASELDRKHTAATAAARSPSISSARTAQLGPAKVQ